MRDEMIEQMTRLGVGVWVRVRVWVLGSISIKEMPIQMSVCRVGSSRVDRDTVDDSESNDQSLA